MARNLTLVPPPGFPRPSWRRWIGGDKHDRHAIIHPASFIGVIFLLLYIIVAASCVSRSRHVKLGSPVAALRQVVVLQTRPDSHLGIFGLPKGQDRLAGSSVRPDSFESSGQVSAGWQRKPAPGLRRRRHDRSDRHLPLRHKLKR
jgi:hypothetical protein